MFEEVLNEAANLLPKYKNGIEVYDLWKYLIKTSGFKNYMIPEYFSDFVAMLEGDKRFEIISLNEEDHVVEEKGLNPFEINEREKLNIDLLQIVRLKSFIEDDSDEAPSLAHTTAIADKMKGIHSKKIKNIKNKFLTNKQKPKVKKK